MSPAFIQRTRDERRTSRISATLRALAISCAHKHRQFHKHRHSFLKRLQALSRGRPSPPIPSPPSDLGHVYLLCALIGEERVHTV